MDESVVKRIMPHSTEAEQSVIGAMLMSADAIDIAAENLSKEDFYQGQYGIVFEALTELRSEGISADLVTLQDRLKEKNVPPEIAEMDFIKDLLKFQTTSVNAKDYVRIVKGKALLRQVIRGAEDVENTCFSGSGSVDELIEESERKMFGVFQKRNSNEFIPIRRVVLDALDSIEKASKTRGGVTGIPTGFTDLDLKMSGLQNSNLIIVAARPAMGKTSFILNMAADIAFRQERRVAIFSLEMSKHELVNRLFSQEARIDSMKLKNGNLKDDEWGKLIEAAGVVGRSKLMIDDTPGITVRELRSKCRKMQLEHGLDVVMIDYLQLMSGSGKRGESRQQEITEISRALKGLARELNVPVIALSQLSRAVETRTEHRPMLADLRESGAIEQDADIVIFLYRDEVYNKDTELKGVAEVIIAKQRHGPIGTINLAWLPDYTKFANLAK